MQQEIPLPPNVQLTNAVHTDVKFPQPFDMTMQLVGDKSTLTEIVFLIAYIRDVILSHQPAKINLDIGQHLNSAYFGFTVNGEPVADIKAQKNISIN